MKLIPLTQGQFAKVDDEDYEYLMQWKWYAAWEKSVKSFYVQRANYLTGKRSCIKMHRLLLNVKDKNIQVDHKNHDTLDNRREI